MPIGSSLSSVGAYGPGEMGRFDEMKGVLLSRYKWIIMRIAANPELANTCAEVLAPSPPELPVDDCVR
jgi:hypothetical protein